MLSRLSAQVHEIRLDLHGRWLHRQERAALRRLGEEVASRHDRAWGGELERLAAEIGTMTRQVELLAGESAASLAADRADLGRVAPWVRPVVVARGLCARAVLQHRIGAARRSMRPLHEKLGELAERGHHARPGREVMTARGGLARVREERESRLAAFGGTAHPLWIRRVTGEALGFARAVLNQLRSVLLPKAPALAGMTVGWWIANTYTDSHLRSAFRSVGIGSGGTHVVSGSTYKAMSFWLPLLAAAVCAYLGERIVGYYRVSRGRES